MKKIISLMLLTLLIFTLSGCAFINSFLEEEEVVITVLLGLGGESGDETLSVPVGESVTIEASPAMGYSFTEWVNTVTLETVSTDNPFTFIASESITLRANFRELATFTFNVSDNYNLGSVTLNQENPLLEDSTVTITAGAVEGYDFEHFYDLDTKEIIRFTNTYTTTVFRARNIQAIYSPSDEYHLYIYTNISKTLGEDALHREVITVKKGDPVTLQSDPKGAYTFKQYFNLMDSEVLSSDASYTFTPESSLVIASMYHFRLEAVQTYFAGFDDTTKSSYAEGVVTTNGGDWLLSDALLGARADDKFENTRAIRLNNSGESFANNQFLTPNLSRIIFKAAIYGDEVIDDLTILVSSDETNWTVIETITLTHDLTEYTIDLETIGDYYIRFEGGTSRINIDSVSLFEETYHIPSNPRFLASIDTLTFPNNSDRVELVFDASFSPYLNYNEPFDTNGCVAVDETLGEFNCEIYGEVDTSDLGEYEVTFYYLDVDGNYASETMTILVLRDASVMAIDYTGYYDGLEGLYGEALLLALRALINEGVTRTSYEEAKTILADSDVDPNDSTKVLTIYSRDSVNRTWDSTSWHREHVWPNSRLGIPRVTESQRNIASDLHNLRAIVPSINSSRSNRFFDNEADVTSLSFYPGSLDEGDVFRILMYMITMYPELELINEILENDPETNYTPEGAKLGKFSTIIAWHFNDPVDDFEMHRNNVIYTHQNNRNPFIDHPHFVELILFDNEYLPLP